MHKLVNYFNKNKLLDKINIKEIVGKVEHSFIDDFIVEKMVEYTQKLDMK